MSRIRVCSDQGDQSPDQSPDQPQGVATVMVEKRDVHGINSHGRNFTAPVAERGRCTKSNGRWRGAERRWPRRAGRALQ